MEIKKLFLETKKQLDQNEKLKARKDSEAWGYTSMPEGFILNEGIERAELEAFLKHSPVPVPELLKNIWLETNGFMAIWEYTDGCTLSFGIVPVIEAFGGARDIEQMRENTGSDTLLQWCVLDPEQFELSAEFGFQDTSGLTYEYFTELLTNCIFLEYFSADMTWYTLLKLDAKEGSPELYFAYENGLYPLNLSLEEYIKKMFEMKGLIMPWPLLFVYKDNINELVLSIIETTLEKTRKYARELGFEINVS
jgi:hypothetical protein